MISMTPPKTTHPAHPDESSRYWLVVVLPVDIELRCEVSVIALSS
jgi:hypothetical protein